MKALSKLQVWTTPIWLILMIGPTTYLIHKEPNLVGSFATYAGNSGYAPVDMAAIMLGAGVCLSLIMQIGEQIDYLRLWKATCLRYWLKFWVSTQTLLLRGSSSLQRILQSINIC